MVKIAFADVGDNGIVERFVMNCLSTIDVEISDDPDIVFCGDFDTHDFLKYDCIRIYITGELEYPDFNVYDYAIGSLHLEMEDRYIRYPFYLWRDGTLGEFEEALHRDILPEKAFHRKFCNYMVSNGTLVNPIRHQFFEFLSKYQKVDSGGRYKNNIGYFVDDKKSFQGEYKFSIAFENETAPGYITEKIVEAYNAGTVPIYWGAPDICREFNEDAFINVSRFNTLAEAVNYISLVNEDKDRYMQILNAPLVKNECLSKKIYDNDEAGDFIRRILQQNKESAYRRASNGRVAVLESRYRRSVYAKATEEIISQEMSLIKWIKSKNVDSLYIYGAGIIGKILCDILPRWGISVRGIIDRSKSGTYKNISIMNIENLTLSQHDLV
ncbi:MAG: hypothetical protein J6H31_12110 [Butyrivibrio sp.]|nr:hypothetical protein [Butyrivibrio sp.]